MYAYFRGLRRPVFSDLGPAALFLRSQSGRTVQDDELFLNKLIAERPDDPFPHFELARMAIETTPALAVSRFEEFLDRIDSGRIRLQPLESGYRVSAMYKLAFLYQRERGIPEALDMYRRIVAISPRYAEANSNIAALCGQVAESMTTGPERIRILEDGIAAAREQERYNYLGRARANASDLRGRLRLLLLETKADLGAQTTGPARSTGR